MGSSNSFPLITERILQCDNIYISSKPKSTRDLRDVVFEIVSAVDNEMQTRIKRVNVLIGSKVVDIIGSDSQILSARVVPSLFKKDVSSLVVVTAQKCAVITPTLIDDRLGFISEVSHAPPTPLLIDPKYICGHSILTECCQGLQFTGAFELSHEGYVSRNLGTYIGSYSYIGVEARTQCGKTVHMVDFKIRGQ